MQRMTLAMMMYSGVALFLAGIAFVTNDYFDHAQMLRQELSTAAGLLTPWSATALSVRDPVTAGRALQTLRADGRIIAAALFASDDRLAPLAGYRRTDSAGAPLPAAGVAGMYSEKGSNLLSQDMSLDGVVVGTLAIRSDTGGLTSLLLRDVSMAALTMIACFIAGFLLTARQRHRIAVPIAVLAESARSISLRHAHDLARSGQCRDEDEVEILSDALDVIVSKSEERESALGTYRTLMENQRAEHAEALELSRVALTAANGKAEESVRLNGAFLANFSHEIRTPMNGVVGMAQLALETDLTPEQRNYISSASNSAGSLLKVINDIIDFSQIETGGLSLERTKFSISETLCDVMRVFSPAAREKGLSLLLEVNADVPATVVGDRGKLRQVMVSLTENALKFTDTGTVTVQVLPVFYSDTAAGLHFKVVDTGRGLAREQFERAVTPFENVPDSGKRLSGGTGLGLAISNRLIGMLGGCLWLNSELGSGSTFHFTATFDTPERTLSHPEDLSSLHDVKVLIADENSSSRRILEQLVSRWNMRPAVAASASEALELMRSAVAAGRPFDLALIDHEMHGGDGSELAKEICERSELGRPAVTVLSSIVRVSVTDFTGDCSPSNYLIKPVTHAGLQKAVLSAMRTSRGARESSVVAAARAGGRPPHILVAEDNALNQAVAVSILQKEGYKVTVARDGSEALEAFDRGGLDLILMDVEMPLMSGLEAVRLIRLREMESGGRIAVLALTAHAMSGDRERCLEAGMDDYVTKPLQVGMLRKAVIHWLAESPNPASTGGEPALAT
ncbi:MAG TPA: response regulator [Bryobacteraceae bacterium]|nr:response regulator [Bryobacteraceae bacterium]